ncbi:MAG TPA: hypothetical protein VM802_10210 [Chitinophaga sp.]|uniref:hypothetical protein n=1 Tax=Chitinophaga sp. TaxID=1869181 RepID=UPI002CD333EB|nr:hypothetical protein [Chitinophaga sp.]HVI45236.1 hypothetical protein [Chitinophaga sp.]
MTTLVKKRFDIQVSSAGQAVTQTFQLDKNITSIKGILLSADKEDLLYYRGSQRIEVSKNELFPDGYESKLLMSGINLSPHLRFYETGSLPVGNGIVKIDYRDNGDGRTTFEPYRVSLYLNCEQTD